MTDILTSVIFVYLLRRLHLQVCIRESVDSLCSDDLYMSTPLYKWKSPVHCISKSFLESDGGP